MAEPDRFTFLILALPRSGDIPRSISIGPLVGESPTTPSGGWFSTSSPIDIKPLPPEQASVNRPCARAQHRHTYSQDGQRDVNPRVLSPRRMTRKGDPDFVESNEGSDYWCPETGKQEDTARNHKQVLCEDDRFRRLRREAGDPETDQGDTQTKPDEEQANAGPTVRKGRE